MGYDFLSDKPIYLQIIEYIKECVVSEKLLPKQKLASVRDLSVKFEVNPNTVQKAMVELEEIGLIYAESTNGRFVTSNINVIKKIKQEMVENKVSQFLDEMSKIGFSKEEIINLLRKEN